MKLKDRIAIVTGAASGIGEATAKVFAQEGARLAIWDVNEAGVARVAEEIRGAGGEAIGIKADIASAEEVQAAVNDTMAKYGRIDVLINNAGLRADAMSWKMTEEQWDSIVDVNMKGTFNCCRAIVPIMRYQRYGKIVNTASAAALGNVGQINYAAAKAGVMAMTRTLALEVARHGINVNCVCPAADTGGLRSMPQDKLDRILSGIPLKRLATPEEVGKLHLFLVSEDSSYMTGQVLFLDGGLTVATQRLP